jgi:predicted nucleotidyltransferase
VDLAVRLWAQTVGRQRLEVRRIGYFGSLARGDWGVGSDLDLIIIVEDSKQPFGRRLVDWDTTELPVPVDALVYTEQEWEALSSEGRFRRTLAQEVVWLYEREKFVP